MSLAAGLLFGVGADWADRQTQRFMDEQRELFAGYPEVLQAIDQGESYTLELPQSIYSEATGAEDNRTLTILWGGELLVVCPDLHIYTADDELVPWYIEQDTGRIFSEDGALITAWVYDFETNQLLHAYEGSPSQEYVVRNEAQTVFSYYVPSSRAMFHQFFLIPTAICCILALVLGFALAMPRRLGVGRGFWGKLPLELYVAASAVLAAGVVEASGYLVYLVRDDTLPETMRTLFFVNQTDSETLAAALLFVVFWCGAFLLFQAGASLGMGVRDGFGRYLLCRCWTVRACAWAWRLLGRGARWCAGLLRRALAIDWKQPLERNLAKLLGLNFMLVALCCCFWAFGIAGCLVYTFVLFFILRRYFQHVQAEYDAVRDATARMAGGDLRTPVPTLPADSVLAPVAESLDEVRTGFSRAVAEEVRSQNMKTELITNVSHDLKTPLTAIITYVDLLKDEDLPAEQRREYVATLDKKSQRLKRLIDDLFEVSKAATGNVEFRRENVELGALLRQIQFELEDRTAASGVDFRWSLPEEKVYCVLDGQRSCRIYENLIVNITKYSLPGSRAYIALEPQNGQAVVTMKNISATELDFDPGDITDRFVRGDKSRNTEGSGLGLAIAKSFTELQGGSFKVETDGDLFKATVSFPLEAPPLPPAADGQTAAT